MTKTKSIALIAAIIFFALAAFLFLSPSQAQRERARIEGEIAQAKDSLKISKKRLDFVYDSLKPHAVQKPVSAFALMRGEVKLDSIAYDSLGFRLVSETKFLVRFYNSRLDSLNRRLKELPPK